MVQICKKLKQFYSVSLYLTSKEVTMENFRITEIITIEKLQNLSLSKRINLWKEEFK